MTFKSWLFKNHKFAPTPTGDLARVFLDDVNSIMSTVKSRNRKYLEKTSPENMEAFESAWLAYAKAVFVS